jgi:hypothetical protein
VAQTPAPTVIQAQPQPTPAATVVQAQPQPTPAPTVVQAQPQPTPAPTVVQAQPQPTPAPTAELPVAEEVKEKAKQEAKQELQQDVSLLQHFSMGVYNKIQSKTAGDIKATFLFLEETRKFVYQTIQATGQSGKDVSQEALQFIAYANQRSGQVVSEVSQTVSNYWDTHWLERIVDVIKVIDAEKARIAVAKVKQKNPSLAPAQIAQELINEKVAWATAAGAIASATPGAAALVDLSVTLPLLVQMVYEISFAYDENTQLPQKQGEILTIFALALSGDNLAKLGLRFLLKYSPAPSWSIDAFTNGLLFLTVGYASCQYWEAKAKQAANPATSKAAQTILDNQINAYLAEAQAETSANAINQVFKWAISLKRQLEIS